MKKKILLPTDFSSNSWNAIKYAINMYKNADCTFYLLNAYGYEVHGRMSSEPNAQELKRNYEKSELELAVTLQKINGISKKSNHTFERLSVFDSVYEASKKIVEKNNIDMVVIGSKGDSNSLGLLYGSNTVKMIENITSCPVLAIPENAEYQHSNEIVFPSGFKHNY